jgi:hypothetical protein
MCGALCGASSCGCDSEVYWCEWHNDPPRCCDPCDRCGNWVGPGAGCDCGCYGGYTAPYDHPYGGEYHTGRRPTTSHGGTTYTARQRPPQSSGGSIVAPRTANPYTKARAARKPQQGAKQQVHR